MESLTHLLAQHGYLLLFALGFLEFIGAPIAAVPILIAAGGLAASASGVSVLAIVLAAALGGLLADVTWYVTARLRGRSLVDSVCGLSSNPTACVLGAEKRVASLGPAYLLTAKFVPGAGNLVAAASGFAGIRARAFLFFDGLGVLTWATVWTGLGWRFSDHVEEVIRWAGQFTLWIMAGGGMLIGAAGAWRVMKIRRHRVAHAEAAETRGTATGASGGTVASPPDGAEEED